MDQGMKSFNKWVEEYTDKKNFDRLQDHMMARMLLYSCWDFQQSKIKKLETLLKLEREKVEVLRQANEFYCSEEPDYIGVNDDGSPKVVMRAPWDNGHAARQAKQKVEELQEQINNMEGSDATALLGNSKEN